jgi:hypothetical protein
MDDTYHHAGGGAETRTPIVTNRTFDLFFRIVRLVSGYKGVLLSQYVAGISLFAETVLLRQSL